MPGGPRGGHLPVSVQSAGGEIRGVLLRGVGLRVLFRALTFKVIVPGVIIPKVAALKAERAKLDANLGGIKNMTSLPGVMFVVDIKNEEIAVKEARKLGIPVVGLVDTNCDPDMVDYVIPGNDDAIRAIKLIAGIIANAVIEAKEGVAYSVDEEEESAEEPAAESAEESATSEE